jgi:phospholipid/cholesterol/gamma-HCH transport system permease protein
MKVTEQIDALRTLAAHPVDYLVVPRVLATLIAMPLLTSEAVAIGIAAGYGVGHYLLDIDSAYLLANTIRYTNQFDVVNGVIKSMVFGLLLSLISCYKGMNCGEGAEGVGRSTTEAVVFSSISILMINFFLTLFLTRLLA